MTKELGRGWMTYKNKTGRPRKAPVEQILVDKSPHGWDFWKFPGGQFLGSGSQLLNVKKFFKGRRRFKFIKKNNAGGRLYQRMNPYTYAGVYKTKEGKLGSLLSSTWRYPLSPRDLRTLEGSEKDMNRNIERIEYFGETPHWANRSNVIPNPGRITPKMKDVLRLMDRYHKPGGNVHTAIRMPSGWKIPLEFRNQGDMVKFLKAYQRLSPALRRPFVNPIRKGSKSTGNGPTGRDLVHYILSDPFIYQRLLKPALDRLSVEFHRGTFKRRAWVAALFRVTDLAAAHLAKQAGIPKGKITRRAKLMAAFQLAGELWKNLISKRRS